ncbi:MAG: dockerin type I repeat-containing protein [Bacteroidales bacterium]|nr:dockerin type I repeat-containing protein [Bacteroidales bacterium]
MIRNSVIKAFVLAVLLVMPFCGQAQKLAEFNLNCFDGWTYTRSSVTLNLQSISSYKVNLYGNYMLISPLFSTQNVKHVKAEVTIITKEYQQDRYNIAKASPTLELIDEQGTVVASKKHNYDEALYQQIVEEYLTVPEGAGKLAMRFSAPSADANCTGSVIEVLLTASNTDGVVKGDIDGNGKCDVSDVTDLINIILGDKVINDAADVNENGIVDISDVTALINLILN